ncbi:MAG: ATP F0F1 synthase subunit B [Pseudomonadota bacterium]
MTKFIAYSAASIALSPLALAASSDTPKDEAVGFGYLLYGFTDTTTHVAFGALVVFVMVVLWLGGGKAIFGALDRRSADIRRQLDEAKALREEANKLMAEAETRAKEAEVAADDIVKRAKADAKAFMEKSKAELEAKVARREAQAEQRIARAETEAASDVRKAAADAATEAARAVLSGSGNGDELFAKALDEISSRLN